MHLPASLRPGRTARAAAALLTVALACMTVHTPLAAQQTPPPMQEALDALTRALRERDFQVLAPHLDDAFRAGDLTGGLARQAMERFVASGARIPRAVQVDSVRTDGQGLTHLSTRFSYDGQERAVELVLTGAGRFVEAPLFHVQMTPGTMVAPGRDAAPAGSTTRRPSDAALQQELVRMAALDQQERRAPAAGGVRAPLDSAAARRQRQNDAANLRRLEEIIAQHGWPGVSLVGEEGSRAAFLVLQHGDVSTQERHLPAVRRAAAAGEIAPALAAMLEDRVLVQRGREQTYGTQVRVDPVTHRSALWPVRDAAHVDERRAGVGLGTLADYLRSFGIPYPPPGA